MSISILMLLVGFIVKHYVGDFPGQTVYMLGKGKSGWSWIAPLAAHCSVHALLSLFIIVCYKSEWAWLVFAEFAAHFVIDRIKATYKLPQGQWANEEKGKYLSKYYNAFGLDQMSHYLTYALMVYFISN